MTPNPSPPRFATLDGLRGVAVMGIVTINISAFALPDAAYFNPLAAGGESAADRAAWYAALILFDGKMRGLFAMLFGAGLILFAERAEAEGRRPGHAHAARMGWLLLFGLMHYYLLWSGDILAQYAVIGMVAWFARQWRWRTLLIGAMALIAVQTAALSFHAALLFELREAAGTSGADPATVVRWQSEARRIGADPAAIAAEVARYRDGSYAALIEYRLTRLRFGPALAMAATGLETLAMMLLGMAALKGGLLTGGWPRDACLRLIRWGYGIGLAAMAGLALVIAASGADSLVSFAVVTAWSVPARAPIMLAHAALVLLWLGGRTGGLGERVQAAGRMAFSNYLLTSLVMTTLFYGYGGGWFGELGRVTLTGIVVTMAAIMLLWSRPWLARHHQGPVEWLWRSLAKGKVQPMRRR